MKTLLFVFFYLIIIPLFANHIYGGNLSIKALTDKGDYKVSLVLFLDKRHVDPTANYESATVYIFRKRDNRPMGSPIYLRKDFETPLFKDSPNCNNLYPLDLLSITYSSNIYLSASAYNDPQGYYIIWERCCRNQDIVNIVNPSQTGIVFRLDFPPVTINNKLFKNSSPDFALPPADYVCLHKPFRLYFNATDEDGDVLKYELVNPLAGHTSDFPPSNRIGTGQSYLTYPPITWKQNYSATNAIPGSPSLQINPNTGELTVNANKLGLFTFSVLVHEFRNNTEIGQVRRDFQFPVVDCKQNLIAPFPPIITLNGQPESIVENCDSAKLTLFTENEPDYQYQWQRDGVDIEKETKSSITVSTVGIYTVTKKFFRNCGRDTVSQPLKLYCEIKLYIPNTFTPNGDGINDNWIISTPAKLDDLEVFIFNRWGNLIYYSKGYSQPWDGTFNDKKVASGEYTYRINLPHQPSIFGAIQVIY